MKNECNIHIFFFLEIIAEIADTNPTKSESKQKYPKRI